ncbi:LOG family protein [Limnoglobus roseus]|uniref:Cytokinin riboside 5'-monophosphate phosphoribohydrolase n=1 Tax=Limnoglobus roseus TaxID=2598579 RepID=A0A5C1A513_9BACT|nr:TIGR00730 family Rossman fold protein [Limnoglobus roseus]QEL14201.1 TIGR00730 family Rossman fold protein [Limnoglobus roseus]
MNSVCVFCGSASGTNPLYAETARATGAELARRSLTLVYGGGRVGLMGEVATATVAAGGQVVGIIPGMLAAKEIAFADGAELIVVDTMHVRKAMMADRADAFLALPGGFGTCDELFEILTWAQIGIHQKPIGLLNVAGFYTPLLAWLDHVVIEGLLKPKHRELLIVRETVGELLDALAEWKPVQPVEKWATLAER